MTEAQIYDQLNEIFNDVFMRDDITLRPEMTAADIRGWDSHKQIEIVLMCEESFKAKFSTREIDALGSVGDLVRLIAEKTGKA
uniref:acyl carrier protein n=1 Tax=Methylobacterium sp. B34 TaxID=95563 RepID=UPI001FCCB76E|nr:acyl carrier protein [Methylobacterium sp. B34]